MRLFSLMVLVLCSISLFGQGYWSSTRLTTDLLRNDDVMYLPKEYHAIHLDFADIKKQLASAKDVSLYSSQTVDVYLPMPSGEIVKYNTVYSPVMESALEAKYPSIKTYKGISDDKKSIARFGYGPTGFHASIRTFEGEIYIDQVSKSGGQEYVSYYVKNHGEPTGDLLLSCGTDEGHLIDEIREPVGIANRGDDVELHVYQFALACTGVWGMQRGTVEKALEDMVTSTNRLNQIYENEAGMRLVLIDENDKLIKLDPNADGYSQVDQGRALLVQNTAVINGILGNPNKYDLGHVYTLRCNDVGGVAFLGSMCSGNKGAGVTCHYTNLLYITVQVAAHEIGHQLSAQHTFNNCSDASGNNSNASLGNDFEPGSGSTIMSYGGLCGANNVQGNNDDYYNNGSLVQIYDHIRREGGGAYACAERIPTTNNSPEINIPLENGFYIPGRTYFVLTGEATDENGDALSYNWEQKDAGNTTCNYGSPERDCPLFRSFPAKDVPYRFFPRESRILSASSDASEILPFYDRKLTFSFTVRDNNAEAGIATWKNVQFFADASAGPFRVLTPEIGEKYEQGQKIDVRWNVANTDNERINCQKVDIFLSLDKALHKSDPNLILLEAGVPNSGQADVYLPEIGPSNSARILVMASESIFFDITDFNFSILEATQPRAYFTTSSNREKICLPGGTTISVNTSGIAGFTGNINFDAIDLPQGVTVSFSKSSAIAGESLEVTFDIDNAVPSGNYEWSVRGISDVGDTIVRRFFAEVVSTDFSDLVAVGPEEGLKDSPGLPTFSWSNAFNAEAYIFELNTSPAFEASSIVYNITTPDTSFVTPQFLEKGELYYWRVKALNECGEGDYTFPRTLGTVNLSCNDYMVETGLPVNISSTGVNQYNISLPIFDAGIISDFNIKRLQMSHDFFKDLSAYVVSPKGTEVRVWSNSCANKYNMDVSFDDDANAFFNCANGVTLYKPNNKFSAFNGEDAMGTWVLRIEDNSSGFGGKIDNWQVEVCGSITSNPPILIKNELLQIQPFNAPRINQDYLLVEDLDDADSDIRYILVSVPQYGTLTSYGNVLKVGDYFTQDDLNQSRVYYKNTVENEQDGFYFVVQDSKGGWIEINRFNIEIGSDFPSSTIDAVSHLDITIMPNPAASFIDVNLSGKAANYHTLTVSDMLGKSIQRVEVFEGRQRINLPALADGVYLLSFSNGQHQIVKRFVVQN